MISSGGRQVLWMHFSFPLQSLCVVHPFGVEDVCKKNGLEETVNVGIEEEDRMPIHSIHGRLLVLIQLFPWFWQ